MDYLFILEAPGSGPSLTKCHTQAVQQKLGSAIAVANKLSGDATTLWAQFTWNPDIGFALMYTDFDARMDLGLHMHAVAMIASN